eukprot:CAMPEP_0204119052 /NCGR_PEP_ID=MMETSP0361-20130328/6889_2 /ASSEMBLY_ACC=CAM_ASM_000343 /TAXON_ID=268821 /ORGANISM="Scrippsiella Hangoei, Strain SHTV-5" /LENGTH=86 /DNA_ID=CAMNT_0051070145 /DNA_START=531 /DNA_END=791 /DNA_ORIENTATION=-
MSEPAILWRQLAPTILPTSTQLGLRKNRAASELGVAVCEPARITLGAFGIESALLRLLELLPEVVVWAEVGWVTEHVSAEGHCCTR